MLNNVDIQEVMMSITEIFHSIAISSHIVFILFQFSDQTKRLIILKTLMIYRFI